MTRRIIGIAGPPGAGKSTAAAHVIAADPATRALVPMDGFHLAQSELVRLGRAARKGAPDTFDVDGFVELLERLRACDDRTVYAPRFDRKIEEPIANAIAIEPHHTTVVTEGNYLLVDTDGWERVRPLLDECWFVERDDAARLAGLLARHIAHGRSADAAAAWVLDVDEPNARLVARTRFRADRVITPDQVPSVL